MSEQKPCSTKLKVSRPVQTVWPATTTPVIGGGRVQGCKVQGLDDSSDAKIRHAVCGHHKMIRKQALVAEVEIKLKLKDIIGTLRMGRHRLNNNRARQTQGRGES